MRDMKVVRFHPPGGPEKLQYLTEPVPSRLDHGQMLTEVRAVGLIWPELTWPIYQRPDGTYRTRILGRDFSGVVVETGPGCEGSEVRQGSEVFAFTGFTSEHDFEGAMAQYAIADLDCVALKPKNLDFVQAASAPLSALTAWQALHDHANLQPGQRVLITGAAGGTGVFAVPIAREIGAHIIATASSQRSFDILKESGAHEIIDYKTTDLEVAVKDVDVVLDCVGGAVFKQSLKVVKKSGIVVTLVDYDAEEVARREGVKAKFFIVAVNSPQLREIATLLEKGPLKTTVDAVFPLERYREAFARAMEGHVHGKIVLKVSE